MALQVNCTKHLKEKLIPVLKVSQNVEEEGTLPVFMMPELPSDQSKTDTTRSLQTNSPSEH